MAETSKYWLYGGTGELNLTKHNHFLSIHFYLHSHSGFLRLLAIRLLLLLGRPEGRHHRQAEPALLPRLRLWVDGVPAAQRLRVYVVVGPAGDPARHAHRLRGSAGAVPGHVGAEQEEGGRRRGWGGG